jgi:hypothetical protein
LVVVGHTEKDAVIVGTGMVVVTGMEAVCEMIPVPVNGRPLGDLPTRIERRAARSFIFGRLVVGPSRIMNETEAGIRIKIAGSCT